ncbi:hypothetical protein IB275_30390 [Pseudomonas sp. PDM21]|uniref:hypothetical protein n=1 Tax=Pseudomonas sp. PDM21 TaxID=2769257 RepID=UPI00177D37ED|nr:hypothetical protein [Pseudomonas sp. PDM21]MBD9674925.1 hypothetical protein [Pseudomonas sp. PDM21]
MGDFDSMSPDVRAAAEKLKRENPEAYAAAIEAGKNLTAIIKSLPEAKAAVVAAVLETLSNGNTKLRLEVARLQARLALVEETAVLDALRFGLMNSVGVTMHLENGQHVVAAPGHLGVVVDHVFKQMQS